MHVAERRWSESRMRENRMSGSMRGRRRRAETHRACVLLYKEGEHDVFWLDLLHPRGKLVGVGTRETALYRNLSKRTKIPI